ncbi:MULTISPECIES: hypothetical protein [Bradyrhizobium]|uniref:hypothetical protein n=1 Tax=Bradyrhizobium TaxID=374 RepID=UPI00115210CA|nr:MULTISPECIES: hypothetical protein [Bradyrhizobium]
MSTHVHVQRDPEAEADRHISQVMAQIADYSRDYHQQQPDAPLRHCIEIGAGRVFRGVSSGEESRMVELAIAEMAARWLFESAAKEAAE